MSPARSEQLALSDLVFELTAPHTQQEISEHLGISQQRVSRLEKRALRKMRATLEAEGKEWSGPLFDARPDTSERIKEVAELEQNEPEADSAAAEIKDLYEAYADAPKVVRWLYSAKTRARALGVRFDLQAEDIVIPDRCPLLGIPLLVNRESWRKGPSPNAPSLDRLIPGKGYVKGNVRVISFLANAMKTNATPEQLLEFAKNVPFYVEGLGK